MLRKTLLLPQPCIYVMCCTSKAKWLWCISCHGLSIFPGIGLGKVHGPDTYTITNISTMQTQKQKYVRSQQPEILLGLLLNSLYHCTLTDTTDPIPHTPKPTALFHSQMNKLFWKLVWTSAALMGYWYLPWWGNSPIQLCNPWGSWSEGLGSASETRHLQQNEYVRQQNTSWKEEHRQREGATNRDR